MEPAALLSTYPRFLRAFSVFLSVDPLGTTARVYYYVRFAYNVYDYFSGSFYWS
jgi:hypothetical protein